LGRAAEGLLECVVEVLSSLLKLSLVLVWGVTATAQETPIGKQTQKELRVSDTQTVPYLLHLPAGYDAAADKKWPLMLFLHGRGESFGPLTLVAKWGPPQIASTDESFPYILVSPQCPRDDSWTSELQQAALVQLLDQVLRDHRVDTDRVYLTGLSMGGYGSWKLSAAHPERFAAVAPVCGGRTPQVDAALGLARRPGHGGADREVGRDGAGDPRGGQHIGPLHHARSGRPQQLVGRLRDARTVRMVQPVHDLGPPVGSASQ
jgi:poly(3-hydroxybutyrate) depolymerase